MNNLVAAVVIAGVCSTSGSVASATFRTQAPTGVSTPAKVPDFSGHWVVQPDPEGRDIAKSETGIVVERRPEREFTVTQDAKTLTKSRTGPNGEMKTVLNLDGSDSKLGNLIAHAKWDGSKLVVVDKRDVNGVTLTRTTTWWLDGPLLKIQVKTVENSGPGRASANELVTVATYKKTG